MRYLLIVSVICSALLGCVQQGSRFDPAAINRLTPGVSTAGRNCSTRNAIGREHGAKWWSVAPMAVRLRYCGQPGPGKARRSGWSKRNN